MTAQATNAPAQPAPLQGSQLWVAGMLLAIANFIVVLDMTVTNVSVSHIAGSLAVSPNEGTYVITSYAVAEAITVPLTGWLASRFGTLRVFTFSMILFGICSLLCGLSTSLGMLVVGRILQGLAGGPLMPLSQTLLMQVFPAAKKGTALTLWSMTTLVAPILGPIVGGYICDNWGWEFIFFINIPIALICGVASMHLLKPFETKMLNSKIDFVGLFLLILWVGALQYMLDEGKKLDWFASTEICMLAVIAAVGFASFMIWEFTQEHPVVDLRIFRHRGFSSAVLTISLAFGAYFGSVVLTPLWLQTYMGYTATWSGLTTASSGVLAVLAAPFAAKLSQKVDPRRLVFCGVLWMGIMTFVRSFCTTDMTPWQVAMPMLLQGIGMPFFFVPLTGLAMASVRPEEMASSAGLMSFLRTIAGAFATSIVTTQWDSQTTVFRNDLVTRIESPSQVAAMLGDTSPSGLEAAKGTLDQLVQSQAVMLATNHIFLIVSVIFVFAASVIWLAPKPTHKVDTSGAH